MKRILAILTMAFPLVCFAGSLPGGSPAEAPTETPAETQAEAPNNSKKINVSLSSYALSDSAIMATRALEGERPVQPLNIEIGMAKLTLTGYGQTQFTMNKTGEETSNSFSISRVILMANAQLFKKLNFFIMANIASNKADKYLQEYFAQYDFLPSLKLRIGQFKTPYCLDNIISPRLLGNVSMYESSRYLSGISGDPLYGNYAGRDMGIMLTGDAFKARDGHYWLNYSLALMNGAGINVKDNNRHKDVAGMLNLQPWKGVTFSTSFMIGRGRARDDSPYGGIVAGEDYRRNRWAVGVELKLHPLMLRSEVLLGRDGDVKSRGVYAEVWYRLFKGLDLVASFEHFNKNKSLNCEQQETFDTFTQTNNYLIGFQYWVYKACRVSTQYVFYDRRTGADTKSWITQFQVAF